MVCAWHAVRIATALAAAFVAEGRLHRDGLAPSAGSKIPNPYVESFSQKLDHFNYEDHRQFTQRYFVYNASFRPGGPLFFYTGNEGPLESFYYNTGLPFDWAPSFNALIVFGEHRYYGKTLPFGDASFDKENLGFLSISQALADYAMLVRHVQATYDISAVVALGGSYGGMLSAWARIKYPNVFDMALAASAPIPQGVNLIEDKSTFYRIVTDSARKAHAKCPCAVRSAFSEIIQKASSMEGLKQISDTFQLCKGMNASELDHFLQYVRNAWTEMAMCNYPYPSSFLAPLPAWPMAAACEKVLNATQPIQGLADAVSLLYHQPNQTCFDMYTIFVECADQTGCGTGPASRAWDYQMCTEIFYEQNTNNVSDMFPPRNWTMEKLNRYCSKHYGVKPDPVLNRLQLGGINMTRSASKIIFSNGLLDPWHGGGYLNDQGPTLPAVVIKLGAHHLDLREANPEDPQSVLTARQEEKRLIGLWLSESQGLCDGQSRQSQNGSDAPFSPVMMACMAAFASGVALASTANHCKRRFYSREKDAQMMEALRRSV